VSADPRGAGTAPPGGRIRVLWCSKGLGPGGAERLLVAAAQVADHDTFAYEAAYLLPWKDHLVPELTAAGVRVGCLGGGRDWDLRWLARLARRLRREPVDVVHLHSPYLAGFVRPLVRSLPRRRRPHLVTTEHNAWSTFAAPTRLLNAWTAPLDDATFAVSQETLESMSPRVRARAEVLVHGVALERLRALGAERDAVRAELGVGPATLLVGTVANYRAQKDYPTLLRAARTVADTGADVRFVAVGQGPEETAIAALHAELRLEGVVTLTGYRPDATRVLAGCDAFCLSSRWEGLPVALMEALALGLPVVATAVGGVAETVTDGREGLLVPPEDPSALAEAILSLAADPMRRTAMAAAAARAGERFDIRVAVRRLEDAYRSLVGAGPRPPALRPGAVR
jgi:glycosyltransferase involved in cell wall biosynthesis